MIRFLVIWSLIKILLHDVVIHPIYGLLWVYAEWHDSQRCRDLANMAHGWFATDGDAVQALLRRMRPDASEGSSKRTDR